jgi:hypothetical protein
VGAETLIAEGTMKATRRVVPVTVVTELAAVVAAVPPADGDMPTVTEEARIVPVGKPGPVNVILVMPGYPAAGETALESVT